MPEYDVEVFDASVLGEAFLLAPGLTICEAIPVSAIESTVSW